MQFPFLFILTKRITPAAGLAFLFVLSLTGCIKLPDAAEAPVRNNSNLSGHVTLLNEFQVDSIAGGPITVTVRGNGTEASAQADGSGNYTLENLKPGKYDLSISAPGFITITYPAYEHIGGTPQAAPRFYLYPPSTTVVTGLTAVNDLDTLVIRQVIDTVLRTGITYSITAGDTLYLSFYDSATSAFVPRPVRFNVDTVFNFSQKDTTFGYIKRSYQYSYT